MGGGNLPLPCTFSCHITPGIRNQDWDPWEGGEGRINYNGG